jgi:DNA (cytosine-5)-methyltransferase 1
MVRPRLLDLFCGAGGSAMGYHDAGFDVIGVDIAPQPHYPFEFVQMDAMAVLREFDCRAPGCLHQVDAVHASPPCQRWLGVPRALGDEYPDLPTPTRELLKAIGLPYVIENVPGAPLDGPILCGSTFGLPIIRHRRFETSWDLGLVPSMCHQARWDRGVDHGPTFCAYAHGAWRPRWRAEVMPVVWPWMTLEESGEAIPPAYTEWIGAQLITTLESVIS